MAPQKKTIIAPVNSQKPASLQKCTNIDTIQRQTDHNNSKRTKMHKITTTNPQKTHNTPPQPIMAPQKKTIIAPVNSQKPASLQKCTNIDTIQRQTDHNNSKRTKMHKITTTNPQKTHNTPPQPIMAPQKKTIIAPVNSQKPASLQKCTNIDTIQRQTDHNNSKRTKMHKITTTNPQKTHNTPPQRYNGTTKKDHHRPTSTVRNRLPYRNAQTSTPFKDRRIITTANAQKCTKLQQQILKKHTIPPLSL